MLRKLLQLLIVSSIAAVAVLLPANSGASLPACPPITCADFINNYCSINGCPLTAFVNQGSCDDNGTTRTLYTVACAQCGFTDCYGP